MSDRQRRAYARAAAAEGTSVSALVTAAADTKVDEVLRAQTSMAVPSEVFDQLLAALDEPTTLAPPLEEALRAQRFENR